jgi:hypothetical protein
MGLMSSLLLLPLAPVRGVVWVAEVVADEADRQMAEYSFVDVAVSSQLGVGMGG